MLEINKLASSRNQTLERAVLCGMFQSGNIHPDIDAEMFCGVERQIFLAAQEQLDKHGGIDSYALAEKYPLILEVLETMADDTTRAGIEKLRTCKTERRTAQILNSIDHSSDVFNELNRIVGELSDLSLFRDKKEYEHNKFLLQLTKTIHDGCQMKKDIAGEPFGLRGLERRLNGFEHSKLYVVGALKKSGKSRLMAFIGANLAANGNGVLINSLEMSENQINSLALAYYSGVNSRLFGGTLKKSELDKINDAINHVSALDWVICRDFTTIDLKARIKYLKQKRKIDFVFVDFIQKMKNEKYSRDRVREVESIAQDLADMARECEVGIIALSQLAGRAENLEDEEIPDMSYLKESQGIPENADWIIIQHNYDRKKQPYSESGAYIVPRFGFRLEGRYDVSGSTYECLGDLRTCRFKEVN